ncbi:protein kinase [Candidatus Sumerlaeota bacterium]|nr:protein kinase [Candidatus Sumerlaeota bacterium]
MILSERYGKIETIARYPLGHLLKGTVLEKNENHFIKMLTPPITLPEELYQELFNNLEEESRTIRKMRSSKILRCLYHEREIDALLIGFPFPENPPLSLFIRENHPLSPELVLSLLDQMSSIFSLLFSREIHRFQLEPELLFITPQNHKIVYVDTGMVNLAKNPETIRLGYLDGKPQFLPPELLKSGELGVSSDVYFFAAFAHYLLTGKLHGQNLSPVTEATLTITESLSPANRFRDEREARLNRWLARASAQKPENRMKTVEEFFDGLRDILSPGKK